MKRRDFITRTCRRGGRVASCGARAAARHAGDRVARQQVARRVDGSFAGISPGPERHRLCRGRERGDRIPLGRESNRSTAGAGGRTGSPTGRGDRHERRPRCGVRGQSGNHNDPHRLHCRRRPGQAWSCRQPCPARRQPDRDQLSRWRVGCKAAGTPACAGAHSHCVLLCSSIRPMQRIPRLR